MPSSMSLFPFDAMWRETGNAFRSLELVRAGTKAAVHGLSPADLDRSAVADGPTIGRLLAHAGSAEAWWIHKVWRKESSPEAWRPMLAYGNLAKPPAPGASPALAEILSFLDAVREATRLALIKVTDPELDRASVATPEGSATLRWVLFHLLEHEAHHRGQIALTRRLIGKPADFSAKH